MAVTNVSIQRRTGGEQLTQGKRVRTYTATYKVSCSTLDEDPVTVLAAAGLPTLASTWPGDGGAYCVSRKPEQDELNNAWTVTLEYTSNPDVRTEPDEEEAENPLLRPAVIDRGPVSRQRIVVKDTDGWYVLNSAGEPFNPPVEREEHAPAFSISKNLAFWPAAAELAYTDSIALGSKGLIYGARVGKFNGFSGREAFENGYSFWQVTGEFELDWEGWNKPLIDAGYNEKFDDGVLFYLMPILGANGERPAQPVLLDGSGVPDPYRATPYELAFKKYREEDHSALFSLFGL
jgi:hypothetical protein